MRRIRVGDGFVFGCLSRPAFCGDLLTILPSGFVQALLLLGHHISARVGGSSVVLTLAHLVRPKSDPGIRVSDGSSAISPYEATSPAPRLRSQSNEARRRSLGHRSLVQRPNDLPRSSEKPLLSCLKPAMTICGQLSSVSSALDFERERANRLKAEYFRMVREKA